MDLVPINESEGLLAPKEATLEEMYDNLLLGITALTKQASGLRDEKEFKLLYGRQLSHLKMITDHIILLAMKK